MNQIIKTTMNSTDVFISAFGSIVLKTTEFIVKNSSKIIIDLLNKIM